MKRKKKGRIKRKEEKERKNERKEKERHSLVQQKNVFKNMPLTLPAYR